jgi:small-conductance mechanosensitive channel
VRELVLAAFQAHEGVLDNPAPSVALDGIDNGRLVFNATGYVASPRLAYNVRSALLFEVLQQLRDAELPLSSPPTMLVSPEIAASLAPNLSPTLPAMAAAGPLPPP